MSRREIEMEHGDNVMQDWIEVILVLSVSRLETQTELTEVVVDALETFS